MDIKELNEKLKMKIEYVMTGLIRPYEKNAKLHTEQQINLVAENIKRFGFTQPLVCDKENSLIIGHCRLASALKLGFKEVPVVIMEGLTSDEVKALRIADNKSNESAWEMSLVYDELKDLGNDLICLSGFDDSIAMVGNKLGGVEGDDVDLDRTGVITLMPPESPRLIEKAILYVDDIELYNKLKQAVLDGKFIGNDLISLL